jgi:4-aminobutyrate aminotransferase-like enzyme
VIERERLVERSAELGQRMLELARGQLGALARVRDIRGLGLMIGIECENGDTAISACTAALERGFILLPSGEDGRVLSITPPLCIEEEQIAGAIDALAQALR